ncbi:MAG: tetratricopeptide repeat protein [Planctomycetota bacterium]
MVRILGSTSGIVAHDLGKLTQASECFERSRQIDPHDAHVHRASGRLLYEQGQLTEAMLAFEEAVQQAPDNAEGLAGRGIVGYALGRDLNRVKDDYLRAIGKQAISADNAYLYANLGQVLWELGDLKRSLRCLDAAIEIDPSNHEAISVRVLARLAIDEHASQRDVLQACLDDLRSVFQSTEHPSYWDFCAVAALNARLGDYTRAVRFQRSAVTRAQVGAHKRFREPAEQSLQQYAKKRDFLPR